MNKIKFIKKFANIGLNFIIIIQDINILLKN